MHAISECNESLHAIILSAIILCICNFIGCNFIAIYNFELNSIYCAILCCNFIVQFLVAILQLMQL